MSTRAPVVSCRSCGTKNRVPAARLADRPVCGRCGEGLPAPGEVVELDAGSFDHVIAHPELPVVVDFWAPWCGPCVRFAPVLEGFARSSAGRAVTAKLDVDEAPGIAGRYGIQGVPTIAVFRGGQERARRTGAVPSAELARLVAEASS